MIKKVIISNFKQFEFLELDLNSDLNLIIGNNEAGKTTLFEAINLALSAKINTKYILQELSPYLFNINAIKKYVNKIKNNEQASPPEISIEIYLDDEFDATYKGTNNSKNIDCPGLALKILFDNEFAEEYKTYISQPEKVSTIPIEYYNVEWLSFANGPIKYNKLPMRSFLINHIEHRTNNGADKYISSMIEYSLDRKQNAELALQYRLLKENFSKDPKVKEINDNFSNDENKISEKQAEISVDVSAQNTWDSVLSLYLDDIPFKQIGKGEQNCVNTKLAIKSNLTKSNIIMIEEPETCLSFSNLNKLINHIQTTCEGKQLIISTHNSFVLNKFGIEKAILLNKNNKFAFCQLESSTFNYFKKLPGYDTLRMILANKAILVEGPSDELIVQKAYVKKKGKLPIEDGVDVICVKGLSFLRFLEIAKILKNKVAIVTDNDGDYSKLEEKYADYIKNQYENIKICFSKNNNLKTLEPQMFEAGNNKEYFKLLFERPKEESEEDFREYFCKDYKKTEVALKIFDDQSGKINYPEYIEDAIS